MLSAIGTNSEAPWLDEIILSQELHGPFRLWCLENNFDSERYLVNDIIK